MVDKDRIAGSAKVIKGAVKEAIGKATGDAKLETEGKHSEGRAEGVKLVCGTRKSLAPTSSTMPTKPSVGLTTSCKP